MAISNAWTDPDTIEAVATEEARAADFNAALGNALYLYQTPQVAVRLTATQEVAASTDHLIEWDEAPWGDTGMWDEASPGVVVIERTGVYNINCSALFGETESGDTSKRALFLRINGGSGNRRGIQLPATNPTELVLPVETSLAATDYIEIFARHTYSAAVDLQPSRTVMTVRWVAPFNVDEDA